MNNSSLDRVVTPSGLTGLMPPKRLGRRIGMPNTVVRSFQAPRPIASPSPGNIPPSLTPGARGALSTLKFALGGLAGAPMQPPQPGFGPQPTGGAQTLPPGPFRPIPAPFGQPGTNPPMMQGPLGMGRGMNFRQPGMRMAMGGPVDFEQVLGNSAGVPQAMQAYGSPMRLAEGGAGWWGPFQHARVAGASGAAALSEQRHKMGPEDLISQAPNYAGTARALGTPGDSEDEQIGLSDFGPYGRGWHGTAKTLQDFGRGALRGAKHWPAEIGEFLGLPASIPLEMLNHKYMGASSEDAKIEGRRNLADNIREHLQRGTPIDPQYTNAYSSDPSGMMPPPTGIRPALTREADLEYQRQHAMASRERDLDAYPSMTAAPSRAENIGQESVAWLNPGFLAGPLAAAGNWLARPAVKGLSASTRRAYRIPRQVPLSRGLGSRPYDYARFGSGAGEADIPESIQASLGVK